MHIDQHDLSRTSFHIEATMRSPDGATHTHSEAHRLGVPAEDGKGTIVSYSEDWAHEQAEAVADEMGWEVLEVDTFYWTDPGVTYGSDLDIAHD